MLHLQHGDGFSAIVNIIEYQVVADAYAEGISPSPEFGAPVRSRIVPQANECIPDPLPGTTLQPVQALLSPISHP